MKPSTSALVEPFRGGQNPCVLPAWANHRISRRQKKNTQHRLESSLHDERVENGANLLTKKIRNKHHTHRSPAVGRGETQGEKEGKTEHGPDERLRALKGKEDGDPAGLLRLGTKKPKNLFPLFVFAVLKKYGRCVRFIFGPFFLKNLPCFLKKNVG